jgi:hypothetical protein
MKYPLLAGLLLFVASNGAWAKCPALDPASLWLPKDKAFAAERFVAKAKRLHASGQCVIEGSFGTSYQKFYITVSPTGEVSTDAKILRFTYEELAK